MATIKETKEIMGNNFWGVEDWLATTNRVKFTKNQLKELDEFGWDENILNSKCPFLFCDKVVKDCHFAFLGIETIKDPIYGTSSFLGWKFHDIFPGLGDLPKIEVLDWRIESERAAERQSCKLRWYLMHLETIPPPPNKSGLDSYEFQRFPPEYEVPEAIEEKTKNILFFLKNGVWLNLNTWEWCHKINPTGAYCVVGGPKAKIFLIQYLDEYDLTFGVAASRKP